ncbi:MAG TPA: DUF2487 family protein [Bacillota bacterium]|nr:DUF2487 family protein [Bacillota bacterium]
MRWKVEDIEKYEQAKEYIDTAVIPVFSFDPNLLGIEVVLEQTWLEEVCVYAERQLTGRVVLFPTLYLFNNEPSFCNINFTTFSHHLFVTTNQEIAEQLEKAHFNVYLLARQDKEEELALMVREGKKLSQYIMENW